MKTTAMLLPAMAAGLFVLSSAQAQPPRTQGADMAMGDQSMEMPIQRMRPPRPPAPPRFPSPRELARMVPPEPISEEVIRERFAKRREQLVEMLTEDRQAAERYAQDFARYQKQQADSLSKIMARAEERRKAILKHLEEREAQVLERFRQNRQNQKSDGNNTTTAQ